MRSMLITTLMMLVISVKSNLAQAERIKDISTVQGVRTNQLIGYGLVVGLDGSGDQTTQTPFTVQSLTNMLSQLGVQLPPGTNLQLRNVAAVMLTASLQPFAKPGQQIDVTVSSLGNAKSLRGGTLLLAPLKGADGQIYAMAQGNVIIAGAGASAGGSKVQINQLNAGRIPGGATVERAVASPFSTAEWLHIELNTADFSTASKTAEAVNRRMGPSTASALDGRVIQVKFPQNAGDRVAFMADLENLEVESVLPPARIVINARTGSVVMNRMVTLEPCAVSHGNLSVTINSTPQVSQPAPFSRGETVATEKSEITVKQDPGQVLLLDGGAKLSDVVKALNSIGVTPQDLLAILQAMKSAGSLKADIEVI
ncbi:MAG: flagellar basal body P-ring protein FlgI [Rhodocyclaceae bacterium]|nr:flagellar basal body P-ring protein FlgI [Rhodocyclaceae bacterium]MCA3019720.1 flagellar basal body P-ring protein FlgI [Rhodocyclaceae bacterium]MCA3021775.1 flagellar basal body P-ring protein FlgI [Rhodocyclaceae bacterium]MCA3026720.1 flagellar basal body P-ring protein FlgI [Rhodocyclaceae bacterium]MCA3030139.1 flagellar basal body P-ring protein FlgI [Rhodocyclaceae bacterium]